MRMMGGVNRRRLRSEICVARPNDDFDSETAARTRPLSFDEIMCRRKNKKISKDIDEGANDSVIMSRKEPAQHTSDLSVCDGYNSNSKEIVVRNVKNRSDDAQKAGSRVKEEKLSKKETDHGKSRGREYHESTLKNELKMNRDTAYRSPRKPEPKQNMLKDTAYPVQTGGRDHVRARIHERPKGNSEHDNEKVNHRDPEVKGRNMDKYRSTSERESKRKDRDVDSAKHTERHLSKRHDSDKRYVPQISEKEETRMDSSRSRNEEARMKRRRSKSPEHNKTKDRRSRSSSPRARKYSTSHGHDLLADKERNDRHNSDGDRSKVSDNGSGSLYRRHGVSSSGLGGYSPRKRKTEAAVKTPSPPRRSPEKRSARWDSNPSGADRESASLAPFAPHHFLQTMPINVVEATRLVLAASNAAMPIGIASTYSSATIKASIDSIQLTQATRPRRRLYIENVPSSASEKEIIQYFNDFLLSSGANHVQDTLPCISCMINKEKGQALVEFLTPEDASSALSFDGRSFSGCSLRIRRPKDFIDVASDSLGKSKADTVAVSDHVKDSPNKIFIGGISETLSSEMLMEIVNAFGPLKAYRFAIDENLNSPCAFVEYVDPSVTVKACAGLNGMKLGGKVLTVAQACVNDSNLDLSGSTPSYGIPEPVKPLLANPTNVLRLHNVLDPETIKLLSEPELEEILEDVRQECARFGAVKSIKVVKTTYDPHSEKQKGKDAEGSHPVTENRFTEQKSQVESVEGLDVDPGGNGCRDFSCVAGTGAVDGVREGERAVNEGEQEACPANIPQEATELADYSCHVEEPESADRNNNNEQRSDRHELGLAVEDKNATDEPHATPQEAHGEHVISVDAQVEPSEDECDNTNEKESRLVLSSMQENPVGKLEEAASVLDNDHVSSGEGEVGTNELAGKTDNGQILEPGCILVEFRRVEASCLAAHSLHGRLFNDQAVTIDYVPLQLYHARFFK